MELRVLQGQEKPAWLKVRAPNGPNYQRLKQLITSERLNTVCFSAACPNIGECWELGTATFMILGNLCTRACRFCDVQTSATPLPVDLNEPERLAATVQKMGLKHVVITSVARDDLTDGGANHFVNCLAAIREKNPGVTLEVLVPDFQGDTKAVSAVLNAGPQVFNHNIETIERLTPKVRSKAQYRRSLEVLRFAKQRAPQIKTKSGIMLGMGETEDEVRQTLVDIRDAGVNILTVGQYLQPSSWHYPLQRFVGLEEFKGYGDFARGLGFSHVESGPLVRSSYHAEKGVVGSAHD